MIQEFDLISSEDSVHVFVYVEDLINKQPFGIGNVMESLTVWLGMALISFIVFTADYKKEKKFFEKQRKVMSSVLRKELNILPLKQNHLTEK